MHAVLQCDGRRADQQRVEGPDARQPRRVGFIGHPLIASSVQYVGEITGGILHEQLPVLNVLLS